MDGGLENKWLIDSGCSRHMTGNKKWFSSLTLLSHKEYVTFGADKKGKVLSTSIKVNDYFTFNDVALVDKLMYNLLSVSQLVDAELDVLFHKTSSQVLDSFGKPVCGISRLGKFFQADFPFVQCSMKCLISQSLFVLWKWHRRLGHLSFILLCQLSGLGLLRGLSLLKFESNLVCAPCRHGHLDSYYIWTLPDPLRFAPWAASSMFLSSLMTILVTLVFFSWKARMKCLNTFDAWL
jgi:hypothetical protein